MVKDGLREIKCFYKQRILCIDESYIFYSTHSFMNTISEEISTLVYQIEERDSQECSEFCTKRKNIETESDE